MKQKRFLCFLLSLCLMLPVNVQAAFNDVDEAGPYAQAITHLYEYGILNGKADGQFAPDDALTRAELAKIATVVSNADLSLSGGGLFSDTPEGYWANSYINSAAQQKLIFGYPDGSFRPEAQLTYAETVTILLRLLGYGTAEIGNRYPAAYIEKAAALGLTEGLSFTAEEQIDRKNVALLLDRALLCDRNSTGTKKEKLITKLDYSVTDECVLLATNKEYKELLTDEVATSIGTYKSVCAEAFSNTGASAKLVLDKDGKIAGVYPISKQHRQLAVESVFGSQITCRENGQKTTLTLDDASLIYYEAKKSNFASLKSELKSGSVLDLYTDNAGNYAYAILTRHELTGPVAVYTEADKTALCRNDGALRVIRDGREASFADLAIYDVLYYDSALHTLYAYCDTASGIYEKAFPNKAAVTSVQISGKTYELETQQAAGLFDDSAGAFAFHTYVTVLLGKDGKIAGAVGAQRDSTDRDYGVLLSCSDKIEDGTKYNYATFLGADGNEQIFKVDKDYTESRGKVLHYTFDENGVMKPKSVKSQQISGYVDVVHNKIGEYFLASNCTIIDLEYAPAVNETPNAVASVIELGDLPQNTVHKYDVLHAQLDENGCISFLVLDDILLSGYQFGVVTKVEKLSSSSTYQIDVGGTVSTYNAGFVARPGKGQPVMARIQNNQLLKIMPLRHIVTNDSFQHIDHEKVQLGDTNYPLAKDVSIYLRTRDYTYNLVSIEDLSSYEITSMNLYIDRVLTNGGQVRVIIFTAKNH